MIVETPSGPELSDPIQRISRHNAGIFSVALNFIEDIGWVGRRYAPPF